MHFARSSKQAQPQSGMGMAGSPAGAMGGALHPARDSSPKAVGAPASEDARCNPNALALSHCQHINSRCYTQSCAGCTGHLAGLKKSDSDLLLQGTEQSRSNSFPSNPSCQSSALCKRGAHAQPWNVQPPPHRLCRRASRGAASRALKQRAAAATAGPSGWRVPRLCHDLCLPGEHV